MYDTLIMVKPGVSFTADELGSVLIDVTRRRSRTLERDGNVFRITTGSALLVLIWSDAPHVLEESERIAEQFEVSTRGCQTRIEMTGNDPDLELYYDCVLIDETLRATDKFVVFDTQAGRQRFHFDMNDVPPVLVEDFATLLSLMEQGELLVEWQVRCDIGPDWIGGGRKIQFSLNRRRLAESPVRSQLMEALLRVVDIPESSADALIMGEGEITHERDSLILDYDWNEGIPYWDTRAQDSGTVVLMAASPQP